MRFELNNVGYLESGNIELGDLTLICGKNNTGKTSATYSIYGFLKKYKRFLEVKIDGSVLNDLKRDNISSINLEEIKKNAQSILEKSSSEFSNDLHKYSH